MDDPIKTARELATHASDIRHLQSDMDKMVKDMDENGKPTRKAASLKRWKC